MRIIERLRKQARETAHNRGHKLLRFLPAVHITNVSSTLCENCGMAVTINSRPPPNGIDISGRAVALNCDNDPDRVDMS